MPSAPEVSPPTTTAPVDPVMVASVSGDPVAPAAQSEGTAQIDVTHTVVALIQGPAEATQYSPVDEVAAGVALWQKVRVAFQIVNSGSAPATVEPLLGYREIGQDPFTAVPEDFEPGAPFRLSPEWVTVEDGTAYGATSAELVPTDFHIPAPDGEPVTGQRSMHDNPAPGLPLAPGQYSEQEFTVSVTSDADPGAWYEFRLLDGAGGPAISGPFARLSVAVAAPVELSLGQQDGLDPGQALSESKSPTTPRYALQRGAVADTSSVHGPYSFATDQCATCHRTHTAKDPQLVSQPGSLSTLCLMCHDGTGASSNVAAQYAGAKANDPATRAIYQHDALTPTAGADAHTSAVDAEFGGVQNRHSECTDCHNPHSARRRRWQPRRHSRVDGLRSAQGRLRGPGDQRARGSAPTYTYFAAQPTVSPTARVPALLQVPLGVHQAALQHRVPADASTYLDKGVEFNPANASFHPVEAAGHATRPRRWPPASPARRPTSCGTSPTASTVRCIELPRETRRRSQPGPGR